MSQCQNCEVDFVITSEDDAFYARIKVPSPTFCPSCREQRRMAIRNERVLYADNCDLCRRRMASMYSPDKPFTGYGRECCVSDKGDPMAYGKPYDWSKPFFAQFRELLEKVPRIAVAQYRGSVNSDYANFTIDVKNVYLTFSCLYSENIYYGRTVDNSKECFDCFNVNSSEKCYWNVDAPRNFNSSFLVRSRDCIDSAFLFDCANCQHCFMSANVRNKQYVFRGEQLTKEEYNEKIVQACMGSQRALEALRVEFATMSRNAIHKFGNIVKSVDCTGDNIVNSKNVTGGFDVYDSENIKYGTRVVGGRDCYDVYGSKAELSNECVASGLDSFNNRSMTFGDTMKESTYVDWCSSSTNLFGCVGLKKKQYCILNTQYTKEEYEALIIKIRAHMNEMPYVDKVGRIYKYGEFFPIEVGCFAYNETLAQEHYPCTKAEAISHGYAWREPDAFAHKPTMTPDDLPNDSKEASDVLIEQVISCPGCSRAYRIIKPELDFLRQQHIALPRNCPDCRYKERFAVRNPLKLWTRACCCAGIASENDIHKNTAAHFHADSHCPNTFETSYAPERPEIVYCETCYQQEVV